MSTKVFSKFLLGVGIAAVVFSTAVNFANAYNSGPNYPGTVVDDNATGTLEWTNPSNATSSDAVFAAAASLDELVSTHYLKATGFNFSIPSGASIDGIEAVISRRIFDPMFACNGGVTDGEVKLVKNGTISGTNLASSSQWDQGIFRDDAFGSLTELWGLSWTAADINSSNFGIAISARTYCAAQIDSISIIVHYTPIGGLTLVASSTSNPSGTDRANGIAIDSTYMYVVGYQNGVDWRIEKRNLSDLAVVASSTANPGTTDIANAIAIDSTYMYVAGYSGADWRIEKRNLSNLAVVASTTANPGINDQARAIAIDGTYMYVAGLRGAGAGSADWHIEKRNLSDLSFVASTSMSFGTLDRADAITIDGGNAYVTGIKDIGFSDTDILIQKFSVSNLSISASSTLSGTKNSFGAADDGTYLYQVGDDGSDWLISKHSLTDLTMVASTTSNPGATDSANAIAIDSTYMYVAGFQDSGDWRIEKRNLSDLAVVASTTANPAGTDYAQAIAVDDTYIYVAGYQDGVDWRIEKYEKAGVSAGTPPSVISISKTSGLTGTTVSNISIVGTDFMSGATVSLKKGESTINASTATFSSSTLLTGVSFNLTGAETGLWDLWVTNTDTGSGTLANAFTVTPFISAPFAARSTTYIVDPPSFHSVSGLSTSNAFKLLFAGGQVSDGFSSSTSFKICAGQLCTLTDFSGPNPAGIPYLSAYRWFANADASSTGAALAAVNTATSAPAQGTPFRLRILTHVPVVNWDPDDANAIDMKLQFAQQSGTCDTAWSGETYADVVAGSGVIRYYNNTSVANGVQIAASSSDPTHSGDAISAQTYQEQNNFTVTSTVSIGQDALWDFSLVDNSAPAATAYCFRVVDSNNASATPERVPEITTAGGASGATVSGTVYSDDGVTTTTSTVALSINGGTKSTASTDGSGVYSFTGLTATSSDVITVWLDNGTTTKSGAAVTRYDTGNITDLHIYKDRLITRHEDSGPLTSGDIDVCTKTLGAGCADSDLHFDVSGGALTIDSDWGLYLWGGDTFVPGGAVTLSPGAVASASGGDIKWASSTSAIAMGGNALSVGGDWDNNVAGTFTPGSDTQTTTFTANSTGFFINTGSAGSFRKVVFNGSGGSWSPHVGFMQVGAASVNPVDAITMLAGTLDNSTGTPAGITVYNGNVTGSGGTIALTQSDFTLWFNATTTANFGSTSGNWSFALLSFGTSATGTSTVSTLTSGSGNISVTATLQVEGGGATGDDLVLNAGNRTWTLSGTSGYPFALLAPPLGKAVLEAASSTFIFSGNNTGGNTLIPLTTYWNLTAGAGAGETYYFESGQTTVENDFALANATDVVDTTSATLVIEGDLAHSAGTLSGTGNVTVKGALAFGASATVALTGGTFEHLINASTTILIQTPAASSLTFNDLKMNNSSSTAMTATLSMGGSGGFTVSNDWTIGDNSSSTYIFTQAPGLPAPSFDIDRDMAISTNGRMNAATSTVNVARNLDVTGVLSPASSSFIFDTTATSTITGGSSLPVYFYNFFSDTAAKSMVFGTSTPYFEIGGLLTLRGAPGNELFVQSNASGTQWQINHQGTENVEFISLRDSGCIATSTDITVINGYTTSIDRGNNDDPCWLLSPTIAVAGTVFSDEGVTAATSTVKLSVGGSTAYTTSTDAGGAYVFPSISRPATSTVMTVWLDNGTSTKAGAAVTRYLGNGDLVGFDIYQNHLIVRHEDAGPLTNANIGVCDSATGSACTDSDLHFNETGGNLTVDNDWGLYIWGGDTLTPGGAVTLSAGGAASGYGGDLKWGSAASAFDIAGNALSVGGDWWNGADGTFTKWTTSTATFAATQSGMRIDPGTQTFTNLVFNGSGGTWSATNTTATVNGNITMTAGTVNSSAGSEQWEVFEGNVTGTAGAFNFTTSTFTMNQNGGDGTLNFGASAADWTFYNLVMQNTAIDSISNFQFVAPNTVTTTISNLFTIGSSDPFALVSMVLASSSNIELAGSAGTPLLYRNQGNVQYQSSTVSYTGNNGGGNTTVVCREAYWNLVLSNASETFVPDQACTASNDTVVDAGVYNFSAVGSSVSQDDFIIGSSGTVTPGTSAVLVGGDFSNAGTFTSGSSTVSISLSAATSTVNGTTTFWDFQVSGADKQVYFGANETFTVNGLLSLSGGAGQHLLVDSTASGTQWFIDHQGTENISYVSLKDSGCDAGSTYITVNPSDTIDRGNNGFCWSFPSLSFAISPLSVNLSLTNINDFTSSATNTLTVTTNGELGYNVTAYAETPLTRIGDSVTIDDWTGTNASPTTWTTTCIAAATCGFGYSTNDADLTQFTSSKFAGFTTSTPGDVVATAAAAAVNEATTMTYRASVDLVQDAGDYQTTIRYIVTPKF